VWEDGTSSSLQAAHDSVVWWVAECEWNLFFILSDWYGLWTLLLVRSPEFNEAEFWYHSVTHAHRVDWFPACYSRRDIWFQECALKS
jgi:hypothetical protein